MNGPGDLQIGNPFLGQLIWLVLGCACAIVFAIAWRRRARRSLATPNRLAKILPNGASSRPIISALLMLLALILVIIAALDIRWGRVARVVPQRGIEVVFVLDVSRSMLAEDVSPNRLDRAKQMIKDTLTEMSGDSVGLVLFAGEARQAIPVTSHYDEFRSRLDSVNVTDINRGGSRLGDAIRVAKNSFLRKSADSKAVVLLTDGEDMESEPIEAAKTASEEDGVTIFTIGLGDMKKGARIPISEGIRKQYIEHNGEPVWSKLDGSVLKQIAEVTGGSYIPAGTKQVNMADFYYGYLADLPDAVVETRTVDNYEARFQWFLAPAVFLMIMDLFLAGRRRLA